jgi:hypothetical protein
MRASTRDLNFSGRPRAFDERAIRTALALTLGAIFAVLAGVIAAAQTIYSGSISPWWILSGFFAWIMVMVSVLLGLARFGRKVESEGEEPRLVGWNYIGPMVLSGSLLVVLGSIGYLIVVFVANCVAGSACASLPSGASPSFLVCLAAGLALLAGAYVLSARGRDTGPKPMIRLRGS